MLFNDPDFNMILSADDKAVYKDSDKTAFPDYPDEKPSKSALIKWLGTGTQITLAINPSNPSIVLALYSVKLHPSMLHLPSNRDSGVPLSSHTTMVREYKTPYDVNKLEDVEF